MNLKKIDGPLTGHEALCAMDAGSESLYVVEFDQGGDQDLGYRFITETGAFFHGFIMPGDVIKQITVWKD